MFLGVKTPPGLFGGVRAGDKAHGRGEQGGFLQAAWRLAVRPAVSLPGAKCPGNMAKHGQNLPGGLPGRLARAPPGRLPGRLAVPPGRPGRPPWAPPRPKRAFSPPKVGLKGLGEVPAGDSRTGGAALRAFSRACEDPLQPPYGAGLPGRFVGQTLGRLRPTTVLTGRWVEVTDAGLLPTSSGGSQLPSLTIERPE